MSTNPTSHVNLDTSHPFSMLLTPEEEASMIDSLLGRLPSIPTTTSAKKRKATDQPSSQQTRIAPGRLRATLSSEILQSLPEIVKALKLGLAFDDTVDADAPSLATLFKAAKVFYDDQTEWEKKSIGYLRATIANYLLQNPKETDIGEALEAYLNKSVETSELATAPAPQRMFSATQPILHNGGPNTAIASAELNSPYHAQSTHTSFATSWSNFETSLETDSAATNSFNHALLQLAQDEASVSNATRIPSAPTATDWLPEDVKEFAVGQAQAFGNYLAIYSARGTYGSTPLKKFIDTIDDDTLASYPTLGKIKLKEWAAAIMYYYSANGTALGFSPENKLRIERLIKRPMS